MRSSPEGVVSSARSPTAASGAATYGPLVQLSEQLGNVLVVAPPEPIARDLVGWLEFAGAVLVGSRMVS